jgi:Protein of unknown function (DUF3047)
VPAPRRGAPACFALGLTFAMLAGAAEAPPLPRFSDATGEAIPPGWTPLEFRKIARRTAYRVVLEEGRTVIRADADASASGLIHRLKADARSTPILRWQWKIAGVVQGSDPASRKGDDYAARVYVAFERPAGERGMFDRMLQAMYGSDLPDSGLNYVWATSTPVDRIVPNAYTDRVRMIAVESGPDKAGRWIDEERDILADYRRAFGRDPPPIAGIAIMTDTDDTGGRATAWYGDVSLGPRPAR